MNTEQAIAKLTEVIRRKHFALNTEQSYRAWLKRYCDCVKRLPAHWRSEQKVEQFLTALAKTGIAAALQGWAMCGKVAVLATFNYDLQCHVPRLPDSVPRSIFQEARRSA